MLTLTTNTQRIKNHGPSRVEVNLTGTSHGRRAELNAVEDNFRPDKVSVQFQVGDHTPGHRQIIRLTQKPGLSRPDQMHIRGTVTHRGMVHGLAAIATEGEEENTVVYRGQIKNDDLLLRQTTDEFGHQNIRGRVGNENVDFRVQKDRGRVDVEGSVGRETLNLSGFDYGAEQNFPMPGLVSAIAFSAFFNQH